MNSTADEEKELITSWDTPAYGDDHPEIGNAQHRVLDGVIAAAVAAVFATVVIVWPTGTPGAGQPDSEIIPSPGVPTVTVVSTVVITETVGT